MVNALLAENGVAMLPGSDFYMSATSLSARVAAVDFDGERAINSWPGSDQVTDDYFHDVFPKIGQGCECISAFLNHLT